MLPRYLIYIFALAALGYPLLAWYQGANFSPGANLMLEVFPALGLLAFVIMWLHIVGGALRGWLEKYINFAAFVRYSSKLVLLLFILHPLLLALGLGLKDFFNLFSYYNALFIQIAIVAWIIFISYDIAKLFKHRDFFVRHWNAVKLISTLGFFLIFFHSLGLGRDLQAGPLRSVWIFYGVSGALATVYTYGIKPFIRTRFSSFLDKI